MLKSLHEELERRAGAPTHGRATPAIQPPRRPSATRPLARQSGEGDLSVAPAAEQAGLRERHLASRVRSRRVRARLRGRRRLRHVCRQRSGAGRRVIAALGAPPDFPIGGRTLRNVLTDEVSLSPAPDSLFQLFSYITGGERRQKAQGARVGRRSRRRRRDARRAGGAGEILGARPDPEAFVEALEPLQPRLYSISSSPQGDAGRISLIGRCGALRPSTAAAARRRLDLLRRPHQAGRPAQGLCAEGARLRPAAGSDRRRSS